MTRTGHFGGGIMNEHGPNVRRKAALSKRQPREFQCLIKKGEGEGPGGSVHCFSHLCIRAIKLSLNETCRQ